MMAFIYGRAVHSMVISLESAFSFPVKLLFIDTIP